MGTTPTNISITATATGWIISKDVDGKKVTMTVTDKNKNGQLDSTDICKTEGGTFTTEELTYAKKSIFKQGKSETTVGDYLNEQATTEQEEARAEAFERQQRARRRAELEYRNAQLDKANKKNSFWGKVGNIGTAVLGGLGALAGFGFGFTGWQYNGGNWNDFGVRSFAGNSQMLEGMSSFMTGKYGNYTNANSWLGDTQAYMPDSNYFANLAQQQAEYMERQKEQYDEYMETLRETQAQQQREKAAKATQERAKKVYEEATDENAIIDPKNKAKIDAIYSPSKKPEDYTEEDKAIIDHIATYPNIPYEAMDKDDSLENGKLNKQLAGAINELINNYKSAKTQDEKDKVISQENINTLKNILPKASQGTLTAEDIKKIDAIIKQPVKKQS